MALRGGFAMSGVPPKPASKRGRRNGPASYGAAQPTIASAARVQERALGFDAHPLVASLWATVQESCEAKFFSAADWERARWELWFANGLFNGERQLTSVA